MQSLYVVAAGTNPVGYQSRAGALGCALYVGDPTGLVASFPSVVVTSTVVATVVLADSGSLTLAQVQAAQAAAAGAEVAQANNSATIQAHVLTRQLQVQAWIAANPGGAVLTPATTLVLAEMINGLCDLLLDLVAGSAGT
jgi:hypothetical protein